MRKLWLSPRWLVILAAVLFPARNAAAQALNPSTLKFSPQVVGTTSPGLVTTLTNNSSTALAITSIMISGDFAQINNCPTPPNTLGPGQACKFLLTFTPGALGTRTGTLTVNDNASNSPQTAQLTGTGVPPVALLPNVLNFASQVLNTTSPAQLVTVANYQTVPLTITSITTSGDFAQSSNCPISPNMLAARSGCTISVTFIPSGLGTRTGTLTVNDNASNSPQTAQLTGTGVSPVALIPSALSFGRQFVNTTSPAQTVTVANYQTVPLTISSISTTGDFADTTNCPLSPHLLAARSSCKIFVTFTPTAAGARSGMLTVQDDASNTPQTAPLTGTGVLPVILSPSSLSFGAQTVNTNSLPQAVTVQNNLPTPLTIFSISTSGSFSQTSNCPLSPNTLAAGANCTISVVFSPKALGALTGTLTVTDNASTSPQTATLSGTGIPSGVIAIGITPGNPSLPVGEQQQLVAIGIYGDGHTQNISGSVTWSSSNPSIASVNKSGLAQASAQGAATISARTGSIQGQTTLTVPPPVVTSIAVTPANSSVPAGASQQFTALLTYSDGSTKDETSEVIWSSSTVAVASINTSGLATTSAAGSTTIQATVGSVIGSATLTVSQPECTAVPAGLAGWWPGDGNTVDLGGSNSGTLQNGAGYGSGEVGQAFTFAGNGASVLVNSAVYSPSAGTVMFWFLSTSGGFMIGSYSGGSNRAPGFAIDAEGNLNWEFGDLVAQSIGQVNPNQWYHVALTYSTSDSGVTVNVYLDGTLVAESIALPNTSWNAQVAFGAYLGAEQPSFAGSLDEIAIFNQALSAQQIQQIYNAFSAGMCKPTLQSVAVSPTNPSLPIGSLLQFDAVGTYSDSKTHDLTTSASWASSDPTVATISAGGGVTAIAANQTTITATFGSASNSTLLTVTPASLLNINITPANSAVFVGDTQQFTARGMYSDGSAQDLTSLVNWSASNANVASIDATGLGLGLTTGTTTIMASFNGTIGSTALMVTLPAPVLVSLSVTPASPSLAIGQNQQFTATGMYSDGTTQNLTSLVLWSSTVPGVAGISTSGLASAVSGGSTMITATSDTINGSAILNVNSAALVSITVKPPSPTIAAGTNQQFSAIATYGDGSTLDLTNSVTWGSSLASVATVNATGMANSLATGQSTVSATAFGVAGSATLAVTSAALVSVVVTPVAPSIPSGTTEQFVATGIFTDSTQQDITTAVQWNSANSSFALVSNAEGSQGLGTGLASGMSVISATSGSVAGSTNLTVSTLALVSITVSPSNPSIAQGTTQQFTAMGTLNDGSTQDVTSSVSWSTDFPLAAAVSSNGLGTGLTVGTAQITASLGGVSGSTLLSVTPATVVSIAINPATAGVPVGVTQAFTAQGTFSDSTLQNVTSSVYWSSSAPGVATVSDSPGTRGIAASEGSGSATIMATLGSVQGTANLTVTTATLAAIQVSPAASMISPGSTLQYTATGIYTDGSSANITANVGWTSSAATVATISNTTGSQGLATGTGTGTSTISASLGTLTASTTLSVQDQLVSISITPASAMVAPGNNQTFTATGIYSSGLRSDLTNSVLWNSSNPNVATIAAGGLATGLEVGQTVITARLGSVSAAVNCGVTPILHVVVIFQENRTPDNMFQDPVLIANGADIASSGMNSLGQVIPLMAGPLAINYDLDHHHASFVAMYDGGKMDGADKIPIVACSGQCQVANPPFAYVQTSDVAPYFQLAEAYTFGDRMFQTNQGPSFPAHQFIIAGTSAPTATSNLFAAENPIGPGDVSGITGCTATPGDTVALIDPTGNESASQYPCFDHPALTDLLDAQDVSWRYYAARSSNIWVGPNAIRHIRFGPDWSNVVSPPSQVLTDIANGKLAGVSWVTPTAAASDHAVGTDGSGPSWVASVVNAIGNSPYWANTAIFITWDDWGGWYDHVPPSIYNSYEYGFRVPLIVVSPYTKPAYISHFTHDFGSILKFIEETYALPSLGYADVPADDFLDCFDFSQSPLPFHTIKAPLGPDYFLHDPRPPADPDDD